MERVPQRALLVTPHPDDAESGCGGTAAKWIAAGAEVYYLICTNGDKGSGDPDMASDRLAAIREKEQLDAAQALGVKGVIFLKHPDGTLEDDHQLRSEVVRAIRKYRPDTVMCMDPYRSRGHTHRDHRVSGQVAIDSVCSFAWRPSYFPEQIRDEKLEPHLVNTIYLWGSEEPDLFVDISEHIDSKVDALKRHASQINDPSGRGDRIRARSKNVGERAGLPFAEAFRVLHFEPQPRWGD